jgi:hypothetical protein
VVLESKKVILKGVKDEKSLCGGNGGIEFFEHGFGNPRVFR